MKTYATYVCNKPIVRLIGDQWHSFISGPVLFVITDHSLHTLMTVDQQHF